MDRAQFITFKRLLKCSLFSHWFHISSEDFLFTQFTWISCRLQPGVNKIKNFFDLFSINNNLNNNSYKVKWFSFRPPRTIFFLSFSPMSFLFAFNCFRAVSKEMSIYFVIIQQSSFHFYFPSTSTFPLEQFSIQCNLSPVGCLCKDQICI